MYGRNRLLKSHMCNYNIEISSLLKRSRRRQVVSVLRNTKAGDEMCQYFRATYIPYSVLMYIGISSQVDTHATQLYARMFMYMLAAGFARASVVKPKVVPAATLNKSF